MLTGDEHEGRSSQRGDRPTFRWNLSIGGVTVRWARGAARGRIPGRLAANTSPRALARGSLVSTLHIPLRFRWPLTDVYF